jgi:hypothetical protein
MMAGVAMPTKGSQPRSLSILIVSADRSLGLYAAVCQTKIGSTNSRKPMPPDVSCAKAIGPERPSARFSCTEITATHGNSSVDASIVTASPARMLLV